MGGTRRTSSEKPFRRCSFPAWGSDQSSLGLAAREALWENSSSNQHVPIKLMTSRLLL